MLSHIMKDRQERLIAFASRTSTSAKQGYSHLEKKGLALYRLALQRNFTITSLTDNCAFNLIYSRYHIRLITVKQSVLPHLLEFKGGHSPLILITTLSVTKQYFT